MGFVMHQLRHTVRCFFLRIVTTRASYVRFVSSKTRVAPLSEHTIPRLELLSAVVLCWTDSKIARYWIVQGQKEWKPFVQHRIDEISVPEECWNHYPGAGNPADLLSRGIDCRELETSVLWWNGLKWLTIFEGLENRKEIVEEPAPEAFFVEMRVKDGKIVTTALAVNGEPAMLCNIIQSEAFSNLGRLLRVTALRLRFIKLLKAQRQGDVNQKPEIHVTGANIAEAELLWIKKV